MSGKVVLITGVTGFIAGHVAHTFLEAGYRVRGTTRGKKAQLLTDTIHVPGLEFVQVDDIATSDLTEALKDVFAVIHVASPLPTRASTEETVNSAVEGTRHVLEATVKAGIEKIVITSTFATVMDPSLMDAFTGKHFTGEEWGSVAREEIEKNSDDGYHVYFAAKILAERAVWQFAEKHPQIDVATILPAFVYGPYADHFPLPKGDGLGTNGFMYLLMTGSEPPMSPPIYVDVRDVGKAHLAALSVPRKPLEEKRYFAIGGELTWKDAMGYLNKRMPNIKTMRLENVMPLPGPPSTYDMSKSDRDLGIKWIKAEDTVIDAVEALLKVQETWTA